MRNRNQGHMNDVFRDNSTRLSPGTVRAPAFFFFITSVKTVILLVTEWMNRTLWGRFLLVEKQKYHAPAALAKASERTEWHFSWPSESNTNGQGVSDKPLDKLPPFPLVGRHLGRTAWNALLIKTERFNGKISLSTAWNISHSLTILWGAQSLWKGSVLRGVLRLTKEKKMQW